MVPELAKYIGLAIHQCGVLEHFVNNAIRALGTDELLVRQTIGSPFRKRIGLLRQLLRDRSDLTPDVVDELCDELGAIARIRNDIAHNPIAARDEDLNESFVLILRDAPEKVREMSENEVKDFGRRSSAALDRMLKLLPQCRNT